MKELACLLQILLLIVLKKSSKRELKQKELFKYLIIFIVEIIETKINKNRFNLKEPMCLFKYSSCNNSKTKATKDS